MPCFELEQADYYFFLRLFPENEVETTWDFFELLCVPLETLPFGLFRYSGLQKFEL